MGHEGPCVRSRNVLERWEAAFPQAKVTRLATAGHYIQEDAPDQIADAIAQS
jgi:pimeloyl-ACP methyl ester carboxylesterase